MTTTTYDRITVDLNNRTADKASDGFIKRAFNSFIAAREVEARRRISVHLSTISDEHLMSLGLSADDVEKLRATHTV